MWFLARYITNMIHAIGNQITNIIGNRFHSEAKAIAHNNQHNNNPFMSSDKKLTTAHQTFNIIFMTQIANNHSINRNIFV
jgi:hypothetical protein